MSGLVLDCTNTQEVVINCVNIDALMRGQRPYIAQSPTPHHLYIVRQELHVGRTRASAQPKRNKRNQAKGAHRVDTSTGFEASV